MNYVSYLRVSTQRQGQSGLGLEAQREIIENAMRGETQTAEFVEVESGRKTATQRPRLRAALACCEATGATLVVAKLDRLARNVAFLANVLESNVNVFFCDFPTANKMMLHVLGAIAQYEAELISQRTRAALNAKKARGEQLGNREALERTRDVATANSARARHERATTSTEHRKRAAMASSLRATGMSLRAIASTMTANGFTSATGKPLRTEQVRRLLASYAQ